MNLESSTTFWQPIASFPNYVDFYIGEPGSSLNEFDNQSKYQASTNLPYAYIIVSLFTNTVE